MASSPNLGPQEPIKFNFSSPLIDPNFKRLQQMHRVTSDDPPARYEIYLQPGIPGALGKLLFYASKENEEIALPKDPNPIKESQDLEKKTENLKRHLKKKDMDNKKNKEILGHKGQKPDDEYKKLLADLAKTDRRIGVCSFDNTKSKRFIIEGASQCPILIETKLKSITGSEVKRRIFMNSFQWEIQKDSEGNFLLYIDGNRRESFKWSKTGIGKNSLGLKLMNREMERVCWSHLEGSGQQQKQQQLCMKHGHTKKEELIFIMSFFALRNYLDSMRVKGAGFFGRKGWGSLEKWKYERYNMASNIKDPIGRTQIQFRLVLKDSPLDFAHEQIICQVTKEKQVLYDITWDPKGGLRFDKKLVPNSTAQVGECSFNSDTIRFLVNPLSSGSSFPGFEELSGEIERKTQRKITTFSVSKGIRKLTWVMDENFEKEMKLKETDTRGGQKEPRNTATLNPADEKIGRFTVYRLDLDDGYDKTEQLIILMGLMAAYVTPLRFNKKQNTISSMFGYLSKPGMKKEQTEKVPYKKRKWYNRL